MSDSAPPGYASRERAVGPELAFPVGVCAAAAATLLTAFYELCVATPRAFSRLTAPDVALPLALAAAALGVFLSRRARRFGAADGCALLACLSAGSAELFTVAFAHGALLDVCEVGVPVIGGVLFGATAVRLVKEVGPALLALEAVPYAMNPLRIALLAACWLGVLLTFPTLGILRRAALLAALLAGTALLLPFVARLFGDVSSRAVRPLAALAPFAALASLGLAHRSVPLAAVRNHPGEVVYTLSTEQAEHVVARSQGGLLLFSDDVLALTSNDARRFAEAEVHPALALATKRARVLALDDATGPVVQEILRWRDVLAVTLVPHDPALAQFARQNRWFSELGARALGDPRIRWVEREAAPFVLQSRDTFDVALLNASDPSGYRSGKYFSRYWLRALRERLTPDGVVAVQATSPLRTPGAFASIVESLRSAGFSLLSYRAALPTLGEWGFVLGFVSPAPLSQRLVAAGSIPSGTEYVNDEVLRTLLAAAPELPKPGVAPVNHLWDQPVVEMYRREDHAFSD